MDGQERGRSGDGEAAERNGRGQQAERQGFGGKSGAAEGQGPKAEADDDLGPSLIKDWNGSLQTGREMNRPLQRFIFIVVLFSTPLPRPSKTPKK